MKPRTDPLLSLIVVTDDTVASVRRLFRFLEVQTIRERLEVVLVTPSGELGTPEPDLTGFHSWKVVELGAVRSMAAARAIGIRAASAPLVALTEEHSFPEPDWAERLVEAHALGFAAVGPAIENFNPVTRVSWANLLVEYGQWMARPRDEDPEHLPGHNSSYRRDLLLEYGERLDEMIQAESVIHWDLRARGHRICLAPEATTHHVNMSRLRCAAVLRVQWGRGFGSTRARSWSGARRLLYVLGAPLIPLVRFRRVLDDLDRVGRVRKVPHGVAPLIFVLLALDGYGELLGYAFGPGRSAALLTPLEFHREHYLIPSDLEALPV